MTRRARLTGALAAVGLVAALAGCGSGSSASVVRINTSGGDLTPVYEKSWWGPLEERTGITVRDTAPADFARLKAQVDSGNIVWDVTEIETSSQYLQAQQQRLIEPLDKVKLQKELDAAEAGDLERDFVKGSIGTHGVWNTQYATILVFDKRKFPDSGEQPTSLADLWDVKKFPGKRCLNASAAYSLETALRADGVPADDLYPLDVDRAIDKLDELKPRVAKFWREGTEPVQLVSSGECVMSTVWNGRPFAAEVLEGVDHLGTAWEHGILHNSWLTIPRGTPNKDQAYKALAQYLTAESGAGLANSTGYASGNARTLELIEPAAKKYLATTPGHLKVLTAQDAQWWLKNGPAAEETYAEWIGA